MKKFFLVIMLTVFVFGNINAQTKTDFEKFVNSFYPVYPYPYAESLYSERSTKVNTVSAEIDMRLYDLFIKKQIRPVALYCQQEDFESYWAYIQLPQTDSVYVLILSPEMRNPACGEGSLLATYSKYNYQLQDTLWIFVSGKMLPQYLENQKIDCYVEVESILNQDSIYVTRNEYNRLRFNNVPRGEPSSKRIKTTTFYTTYKMTVGGKFIKLREKREDEILDPIAEKLKEPEHYVR
jgi:hypothetical protein